jgi:hypothetical protein
LDYAIHIALERYIGSGIFPAKEPLGQVAWYGLAWVGIVG